MARAKRGRGEGGVYQRSSDGLWVGTVSLGYDGNGKRNRRTVYGATKAEVLGKLRELQAKAGRALDAGAARMTVGEYLSHWLENVARPSTRRSTFDRYEQAVKLHLIPAVGGSRLDRFGPSHVEALYAELRRQGKGARTIQMCGTVLGTAMKNAVRRRLIDANPTADIKKDRPKEREGTFLTASQAQRLLAAAVGRRYHALYLLALATGMRQGELFALQWADVDFDRGTLTVRRTLSQIRGEFSLGEPKTKHSRRTIGLPADALDALRAHRLDMFREGHAGKDRAIFCNSAGGFISRTNFLKRDFFPLVERANAVETERAAKEGRDSDLIPTALRFHDLRHTHASLLLSEGHSLKAVSARLGHASVEITLKHYAHCMPGDDDRLTAGIGELLQRA